MDAITEKRINNRHNVWIRAPFTIWILSKIYDCGFNKWQTPNSDYSTTRFLCLLLNIALSFWNACYFAERVIASYHVSKYKMTLGKIDDDDSQISVKKDNKEYNKKCHHDNECHNDKECRQKRQNEYMNQLKLICAVESQLRQCSEIANTIIHAEKDFSEKYDNDKMNDKMDDQTQSIMSSSPPFMSVACQTQQNVSDIPVKEILKESLPSKSSVKSSFSIEHSLPLVEHSLPLVEHSLPLVERIMRTYTSIPDINPTEINRLVQSSIQKLGINSAQ